MGYLVDTSLYCSNSGAHIDVNNDIVCMYVAVTIKHAAHVCDSYMYTVYLYMYLHRDIS